MSTTLENSIWPNVGGTLGENKVAIPDGVTIKWPDGDALVGNFVYKDGKLVGLVDTKALIENGSKTTVLPYDFVDITVDKRLETLMTFNAGERCKRLNINYEVMLPKGYKRLEYLESTGTQYINTGVKLSSESVVECSATLTNDSTSSIALYGSYAEQNKSALFWHLSKLVSGADTHIGQYQGLRWLGSNTVAEVGRKYQFKQTRGEFWIDGELARALDINDFSLDFSAALFCTGHLNEDYFGYKSASRIYSFTISRAGEMQLNLIPCLNDTGTPCMYDIISQEPLYNAGTGQFLYPGAESQVVTSDLDEIFYAKKTAHGIQKLYHVPENFSGSKDEYAIENGFKQLVEPPMPTEGHWIPEWTETDTQLICNWVEADVLEIEQI